MAKVLPNGNLLVRGEWIMLNNGNEYIRITGMIRPEDVTTDNSVSSQKVANARIHYGGTGDLANTQEQGWLTSFSMAPGGRSRRCYEVAPSCCPVLLPVALGMAHASRIRTSARWKGT